MMTSAILSILLNFSSILLVNGLTVQEPFIKITPNIDLESKCLDGTPYIHYIDATAIQNKFLIIIPSTGHCGDQTISSTIQKCYQTSKTLQGSSKLWPQTLKSSGIGSNNPSDSIFWNWTKLMLIGCDATFFQGYASEALPYKDANLFFRGAKNMINSLEWMNKSYGLYNAQQIVLVGISEGEIGSLLWSNYLRDKIKNTTKLRIILDSIFLNFSSMTKQPIIQNSFKNLYKVANKNQSTPLQFCNIKYLDSEWKCLFFQSIIDFVYPSIPILLINSEYDNYVITNYLLVKCLTPGKTVWTLSSCNKSQILFLQEYRKYYQSVIYRYLQTSSTNIWSIGCSTHSITNNGTIYNNGLVKVPGNTGITSKSAIQLFIKQNRVVQFDNFPWPFNEQCAY